VLSGLLRLGLLAVVVVVPTLLVGALVASTPMLASGNLLPRQLCLHGFALLCLLVTPIRRLKVSWSLAWFVANLVLLALISPWRAAGWAGLLDCLAAVAIILGVGSMPVRRLSLLRVLVAVSILGSIAGIAEQWVNLSLGDITRPAGLFASRATAGALVAAALPLSCLVLSRRPLLLSLALTVQGVFLISTRSRVGWVAAVVVVVLLGFRAPRWRGSLVASAVAACLLAALLTPGPLMSWKAERPYVASLKDITTLRLGDRIDVWAESARLFVARPWGTGAGTFEASFAARASNIPSTLAGVRIESPHNEPLRLLFEGGVTGFGLLLWGLWPRRGRCSVRSTALWCSVIAFGLTSLTGKTLTDPPTLVMCAVVVGFLQRARRNTSSMFVSFALAGALVLGMVGVDAPMIFASRAWAQARTAAASGDTRAALELFTPALGASGDLGAWLWAIDLASDARDLRRCTSLCEAALEIFPGHPMLEAQLRACK
jgi:O-antigen ligase